MMAAGVVRMLARSCEASSSCNCASSSARMPSRRTKDEPGGPVRAWNVSTVTLAGLPGYVQRVSSTGGTTRSSRESRLNPDDGARNNHHHYFRAQQGVHGHSSAPRRRRTARGRSHHQGQRCWPGELNFIGRRRCRGGLRVPFLPSLSRCGGAYRVRSAPR